MSLDTENDTTLDSVLDLDDTNDQDNEIDGEELDISFDGEESNNESESRSEESSAIRELRRQNRLLQAKLASNKPTQQQEEAIVLGEKPTFDSCEFDPDKLDKELAAYYERDAKIKERNKAKEDNDKKSKDSQTKELELFEKQKKELNARNFKAAQDEFLSSVTRDQGAAIIRASDNKALMIYVLGTQSDKLDKLLAINDPFRLAAEVGKLESKIKMSKSNTGTAPKPEQRVKGSAAPSQQVGNSKTLERLEKEAEKSGDRSALIAYKKSYLRNK